VELEELQLQEHDRLDRGPAPIGIIMEGQERAERGEVDRLLDPAEVVVSGDDGLEDLVIQLGERDVLGGLEHGLLLGHRAPGHRLFMLDTTTRPLFQQSRWGEGERWTARLGRIPWAEATTIPFSPPGRRCPKGR